VELERFLQLVKEVETSFGSLRPAATAVQSGSGYSSHDVYSSESSLGSFSVREYGVYLSMERALRVGIALCLIS
jgi:hypothetical protein